jgi:hypothetical protein
MARLAPSFHHCNGRIVMAEENLSNHDARWLMRLIYIGFWMSVATFLSVANLSEYVKNGGTHYWEPFVWEYTSCLMAAALALAVYQYCALLHHKDYPILIGVLAHCVGAPMFATCHIVGTYLMRFVIYRISAVAYEPGTVRYIFSFEFTRDLVTYAFLALASYGVVFFLKERARRDEVVRLQGEVSAARLALLQSQLNPHFLFNTLNLISAVLRRSPDLADSLLERLASLLRATLNVGEAPTHSLRAELQILQPYLDIMSARFQDRLRISVEAPDHLLDCEVPTLILIPIVENAIQHGTHRIETLSRVAISAFLSNQQLVLRVFNSEGKLDASSRDGGIGLSNTRERLLRLYRSTARLDLKEHNTGGVEVSISLPFPT